MSADAVTSDVSVLLTAWAFPNVEVGRFRGGAGDHFHRGRAGADHRGLQDVTTVQEDMGCIFCSCDLMYLIVDYTTGLSG